MQTKIKVSGLMLLILDFTGALQVNMNFRGRFSRMLDTFWSRMYPRQPIYLILLCTVSVRHE